MTTDWGNVLTVINKNRQKKQETDEAYELGLELAAVAARYRDAPKLPKPNLLTRLMKKAAPYKVQVPPEAELTQPLAERWIEARRRALVDLTPERALDEVGLRIDEEGLGVLRANPELTLQRFSKPAQERLNDYALKYMEGEKPGEQVGDEERRLFTRLYDLHQEAEKESGGAFRSVFNYLSTGVQLWRKTTPEGQIFFGDPDAQMPELIGGLLEGDEATKYLKARGLVGAMTDASEAFNEEHVQPGIGVLMGGTATALYLLAGRQSDFKDNYDAAIHDGADYVTAGRLAYDKTDMPAGVKAGLELMFDPFIMGTSLRAAAKTVGEGTKLVKATGYLKPSDIQRALYDASVKGGDLIEVAATILRESDVVRKAMGRLPLDEKTRGKELTEVMTGFMKAIRSKRAPSFIPDTLTDDAADELAGLKKEHAWRTPPTGGASISSEDRMWAEVTGQELGAEVAATFESTSPNPASWVTRLVRKISPGDAANTPLDYSVVGASAWNQVTKARMLTPTRELAGQITRILAPKADGAMKRVKLVGKPRIEVGPEKGRQVSDTMWDFLHTPPERVDIWWTGLTRRDRLAYALARKMLDELGEFKVGEGVLKREQLLDLWVPRAFFDRSEYDLLKHEALSFGEGHYKKAFQRDRGFQTIYQGIRGGVDYRADFGAVWEAQVSAAVDAASEKRLLGRLIKQGLVVSEEKAASDLKSIQKLRNAAGKLAEPGHTEASYSRWSRILVGSGRDDVKEAFVKWKEVQLAKGDLEAPLEEIKKKLSEEIGVLTSRVQASERGLPSIGDTRRFGIGYTVKDEKLAKKLLDIIQGGGLNEALRPKGPVKAITTGTAWLRQVTTTYDMSASFLQGLPLLFTEPAAWAKGMEAQYRAFWDDTYRVKWLIENRDDVARAQRAGVEFGSTEFTEAITGLQHGRFDPRTAREKVQAALGKPIVASMTPFNRAFNMFGDAARLEYFKSLELALPGMPTGTTLEQVARHVNAMTGQFNSARIGVMPTQRAIESLLFWSPRYNRAGLALVKAAFGDSGFEGIAARDALLRFAFFGVTGYILSSALMGQRPLLDPRPVSAGGDGAAFLTWELGDVRWGPGSWWLSFARLAAALVATPATTKYASWADVRETGGSATESAVRFMRGKMAPLTGTFWDVVEGRTFLGERLENPLDDPLGLMKSLAKYEANDRLLPFLMSDIIETGDVGYLEKIGAGAAGFGGMRVFPESLFEKRGEIEEAALRGKMNALKVSGDVEDWKTGGLDLPIEWQGLLGIKKVIEADGAWQEVTSQIERDRAVRGDDEDEVWLDLTEQFDAQRAEADEARQAAGEAFADPTSPSYMRGDVLRNALAGVSRSQSAAHRALRNVPKFKKVLEALDSKNRDKVKEAMEEGGMFVGDIAYLKYQQDIVGKLDQSIVEGGFVDPSTGEPDWQAVQEATDGLVEEVARLDKRYSGKDLKAYIDARSHYRGPGEEPLHPAVQAFFDVRDKLLESYWDIPRQLYPNKKELHNALSARGVIPKEGAKVGATELRIAKRRIAMARERFRRQNPEVDAALALFYGNTPLTSKASTLMRQQAALLTQNISSATIYSRTLKPRP